MRELKLEKYGLITLADAAEKYAWAPKTIQNWVRAELLSAVQVGGGRGTFLLDVEELKAFTPPPRGRPEGAKDAKPRKAYKPRGEPAGGAEQKARRKK